MKIYLVKPRNAYIDDLFLDEVRFFSTEERAKEECDKMEAKEKALWEASYQRNFERWRQIDDAYQLILDKGHNAKDVFPYHKRTWKTEAYQLKYAVDSVEVVE